ncbi:MAG TPA: glycosyl hydrolase family 28-related protein, partial [Methylomirabilota bacterium]|nr:glycosyl hydrolase family 28-related protein [Methylomirabilota bacterium]
MQRPEGVDLSRRTLLAGAGALGAGWLAAPAWAAPTRSVREHGARGDGRRDDTAAIQAAIDAAAPGGVIVFPPGDYLSGTLRLRSRLTLRLAEGATLLASPSDRDFAPREKLPYEPFADEETADFAFALLQGRGLERVTIVGPGRIDGNRRARGGPKPIALKQCRHVTVQDVTIENAPNYNVSLLGCEHVDVRGVTIRNGYADGIDADCCRFVRVAGCRVESRDDAICVKSSLALGVRRPTEYVVVTDCTLTNVRNGLKIGTESAGDVRHVVFRNCALTGRAEPLNVLSFGLKPHPSAGVSLQSVDGGRVEQVLVTGITMRDVRAPLFVRLGRRGLGQPVPTAGALARITIRNVTATGAAWPSSITGVPGHDVADVTHRDARHQHLLDAAAV